ncbi:PLP-dependent aminotransferase family protein [Rathayibacter sp. YIM 133350]|uniref:MocR-like transcription factor YczR n=1 Tax=Rathayibacter sp. YIM 133350 TaxID=3131992 RepID=UPI00307DFC32
MTGSPLSARALEDLLGEWRDAAAPAYQALADRIRLLVLDGRIGIDRRLPAERELAERLRLSRTTVTAAYAALRESGFASSRRGSGTLACLPGSSPAALAIVGGGLLDFSKAALPAAPQLAEAAVRAAAELPRHLGGSGFDPIGLPDLRAAIAARYGVRGLPTDPEQIMVTIGAQHAIALICRVLLGRGDRVLIEQPSYPHAYEAVRQAGARLVPVSVTSDEGWDEQQLVGGIRATSPAMGYLMPDFHNPTGRSMPAGQRERMLAAAARQGTVIVADETTAELDIDRTGELLPLAAYGPAVLIGSVGKTVWGGVRIGWIRAERSLIRKLVAARSSGDLGTPVLEQLIVADLLGEGWSGILRERGDVLRRGRAAVETALAARVPEWTVPHVDGGLSTWVHLGAPLSSQLALAARTQGLLVAAGPRFGAEGAFERFLRVPIGYSTEEIDRAADALARSWQGLVRNPMPDTGFLADVV